MNDLFKFLRRLYGSPALLWKACAAVLFIVLAIAIFFVPSITGMEDKSRYAFAGVLFIYGIFRFGTFYMAYKKSEDE